METGMEKECSALGGLFQAVINDLKVGVPVWEDFITKATKLHSQLKATILSTTAFLDAFQKIADLATNTRGATKDVGTALTRICLRHKAVEARMKTFNSALMECLVMPLQDKMEDWKKTVVQLDKDHAKEYKRARHEIKKKSSDTLRLQKKVRKGKCEIQRVLDSALQEVTDKFVVLEETEKMALRSALIEERSRFCLFVSFLKPVVDEEMSMLSETAHLQEVMELLLKQTADPFTLPMSTEQFVNELKNAEGSSWSFQTPPSSPSSVCSRKSSMCSLNSSLNSSSSGSPKLLQGPRYRSQSQQPLVVGAPLRLPSVSSQDSGFTSQDTIFVRPHTPPPLELIRQVSGAVEQGALNSSYGVLPMATATWPNLQETAQFDNGNCPIVSDRPHTISSAYEQRNHQRPALTVHTFEPLDSINHRARLVNSTPASPSVVVGTFEQSSSAAKGFVPATRDQPVIPRRAMMLSGPSVPDKSSKMRYSKVLSQQSPLKMAALPNFHQLVPNQIIPQPLYVNMDELMGSRRSEQIYARTRECHQQQQQHPAFINGPIEEQTSNVQRSKEPASNQKVESEDRLTTAADGYNLVEASKYCTMPRYNLHQRSSNGAAGHIRPATSAGQIGGRHVGYGTVQSRAGSLRRSVSQSQRPPPPPVRRTSSITSQHSLTVFAARNNGNSLPGCEVSSSVADDEQSSVNGASMSQHDDSKDKDDEVELRATAPDRGPPAAALLKSRKSLPTMNTTDMSLASTTPPVRKTSLVEVSVAINRANLIQSLNARLTQQQQQQEQQQQQQQEQQQQPARELLPPPPLPPPKTPTSQQSSLDTPTIADDSTVNDQLVTTTSTEHGFHENFLQSLNAKLAQHVQKNAPKSPQPVQSKPSTVKGPLSSTADESRNSFKEALNAKLAQQKNNNNSGATTATAVGQHQKPAMTTTTCDPSGSACPESLLDQIKRGASLRKVVGPVNDRSAPRIRQ